MTKPLPIPTPCVGICSTVFGDQVCRGCKRYADEIIQWNGYSADEKRAIDARLEAHLVQILADKVTVLDADLFKDQLHEYNVRFSSNRTPLCWVNDLLRTNVLEQYDISTFGLSLAPAMQALTVAQLRDAIDNELLALSEAHHQRYIAP